MAGLPAKPLRASGAPVSASPRYEVLGQLGAGGMGAVFRVFDHVAGEIRALKRLSARSQERHTIAAFQREYQVLFSLDHPRIIRVFDYGVDEQGPYYTMELLEGRDMRQLAPLPFKQACLCLRDVATSLALLHARRLIHRDVSPGNVRMTADGHCKLLDFGALAGFGPNRLIVGTPPNIAPEVLEGHALDQRVDLYALGALAYWMLTGTHAYPARELRELNERWSAKPVAPSRVVRDIPEALDALVLSLLRRDPMARPESAAVVIAQLEEIADLPAEASADSQRLAQSFLQSPRFIGRAAQLHTLGKVVDGVLATKGGSVLIEALAGMGRTRLLDEISVRSMQGGAIVLRADASMAREQFAAARALVLQLFDAAPELALEAAQRYRRALAVLGGEVLQRLQTQAPESDEALPLEQLFLEVSASRPLVLLVDNCELADDWSIGLLAQLASRSAQHALCVIATARLGGTSTERFGLVQLRSQGQQLQVSGFSEWETHELVRSIFGSVPNAEGFADWLHACTAGTPLFAIELCHQLVSQNIIRYGGGLWTLPFDRPDALLPAALGEALAWRLSSLGEPARALAECLALQRAQPSVQLCRLLVAPDQEGRALELLAELTRHAVLDSSDDGYRFSSTAVRDALLANMDSRERAMNHRRLGAALAQLADDQQLSLKARAGWHFIQGDDAMRGADMIADCAADRARMTMAIANQEGMGPLLEAALKVYRRERCSLYERLPLLASLANAGYYEDRAMYERYSDDALDAFDDLAGMRSARRLRPFVGRLLALIVGLGSGYVRFLLTPKRERRYPFGRLLEMMFGSITALSGTAALALDAARISRMLRLIEPFTVLPERATPVGIYQFCTSLQQIAFEKQTTATGQLEGLLARFRDRRYYRELPQELRSFYTVPLQFALGGFAMLRADGRETLQRADALDASGMKLYALMASELRYLYYLLRGEFALAEPHRRQVELHAAQVGSTWQVETWGAPALLLLYAYVLSDIVGLTRLTHRLEVMSRTVPSLRSYQRLAEHALALSRGDAHVISRFDEYTSAEPRSFIGWAVCIATVARSFSQIGDHVRAKQICEDALRHVTDADREYAPVFLPLDLQQAYADAGLGDYAAALARLDGLIARFATVEHPLAHGMLHEARARICWSAGDREGYERSRVEMKRQFRATESPMLIAHCEQVAQLSRPSTPANDQQPVSTVTGSETIAKTVERSAGHKDK